MATNDQVKTLVKNHAEDDDSQFYAVAVQVAARVARPGQPRFIQELHDPVNDLREQSMQRSRIVVVVPFPQPKGELGTLLDVSYPDARPSDLVLTDKLQEWLTHALLGQRQHDVLARHGLTPVRRLLLVGLPGTGKISTTRVIAGELGLPLFLTRLDTVSTKFIGETATKLRPVFDASAQTREVYLLDEVDALGGDHVAQNDIGEICRAPNSFFQSLEEDTPDSVIIAATNHPNLLDNALFHRSDMVMDSTLPENAIIKSVIKNRLSPFQTYNLSWTHIIPAAHDLNHVEIATVAENVTRRTVPSGCTRIRTDDIIIASEKRPRPHQ